MPKGYIDVYDTDKKLQKVYIKTKMFRTHNIMASFDNEALLLQETDKAILVRVWNGNCFGQTGIWIPKSKLIEFTEVD